MEVDFDEWMRDAARERKRGQVRAMESGRAAIAARAASEEAVPA
jgi:hypothetical protein